MRFDLVLGEPARLPGVVLDSAGKPLPGVRVGLVYGAAFFHLLYGNSWADAYPFAATADGAGRFELSGLPSGKARLYLMPSLAASVEVELTAGRTHFPVELRVPEAAVKGRVLDSDGNPVSGALVYVAPSGARGTDAEGRFELMEKPPEIIVCAEGHVPFRHVVDSAVLEVRLPAATLSGTVTRLDGRGAAGIFVTFRTKEGYPGSATTDERGRFRLRGATADEYSVGVRSNMGWELIGPDQNVAGPCDDIVLLLATPDEAESRRVRGTVVDESGKPIDEPVTYGVFRGGPIDDWWTAEKRAGALGGFVCRTLEPRGDMKIVFSTRGYVESKPIDVRFDGRTPVEPLTVRLRRGAEVEVTVREEDGTPAPGVFVYCYTDQGIQGNTDPDGRCILAGLPPGRWRITVSHPHLTDMKEAYVDATMETRQQIELRGKVAGHIVARLAPGAKPTSIVLRLQDSTGGTLCVENLEKARLALLEQNRWQYDFAVTANGTYRIQCEIDGVALPEAEVEARLRETAEVDLKPAR